VTPARSGGSSPRMAEQSCRAKGFGAWFAVSRTTQGCPMAKPRDTHTTNCTWLLYIGLLLIVAAVTLATIYAGGMLR
jgi:hypothetical protein